MANADRISEVYQGDLWSEQAQRIARERIHWMCSQARGRVLDLGCSQGIASIILGREGLATVGVDHETSRVTWAQADLRGEDAFVARRVSFLVAEGRELPFGSGLFDSILLGEVVEHLALPDLVLEEASRVLVPGGRLVVTTPLGYHPFHDHKASFYPSSITRLLERWFVIERVEVTERYLLLVGHRPKPGSEPGGAAEATLAAQDSLERAMLGIEKELEAVRLARAKERKRIRHLQDEIAMVRARGEEAASALAEARTAVGEAERRLEQRSEEVEALRSKLTDGERRMSAALRESEELEQRLRHALWQVESERSRRSSRLGREFRGAWPNPLRLLRLPFRAVRILSSKPAVGRHPEPLPPTGRDD